MLKENLKSNTDIASRMQISDKQQSEELIEKFYAGIESLIKICGDNPLRDGLLDTPQRFLRSFLEYTQGNLEDPKKHLLKVFDVQCDDIVIVKDIEVYSMCEHHFAPFSGVAHIGYIPSKKVTGLSKFARLVEGYSKRFQVQERLTKQIADAIYEVLEPKGSIVIIEAKHMCMCGRGVKKPNSSTVTISSNGIFKKDRELRKEFINIINS